MEFSGSVVRIVFATKKHYHAVLFQIVPPKNNDEEPEVPIEYKYVVLEDNDILPSLDTRYVYTVVAEITDRTTFLTKTEANAQHKACDSFVAPIYRLLGVVDYKRKFKEFNRAMMVTFFSPDDRKEARKALIGTGPRAKELRDEYIMNANQGMELINRVPELKSKRAALCIMWECFTLEWIVRLVVQGMGRPSSFMRMAVEEFEKFLDYVHMEKVPPELVSLVYPQHFSTVIRRPNQLPTPSSAFSLSISVAMRSLRFFPCEEPEEWYPYVDMDLETNAMVLKSDQKRVNKFWSFLDAIGDVWLLSCQRQSHFLWADKLHLLFGQVVTYNSDTIYVAPSPGHAAAVPDLPVLSYQDVISPAKHYDRNVLVVLFAERWGYSRLLELIEQIKPSKLILVGTHTDTFGSNIETDRGHPFHDCIVRYYKNLLSARLEFLEGFAPLGCLTSEQHQRLIRGDLECVPLVRPSSDTALKVYGKIANAVTHELYQDYIVDPILGHVGQVSSYRNITHLGTKQYVETTGLDRSVQDPLLRLAQFSRTSKSGISHRVCCGNYEGAILDFHHYAPAQNQAVRVLARATPNPVADEVCLIVTPKTTMEDVLAAASLARNQLSFVIVDESGNALFHPTSLPQNIRVKPVFPPHVDPTAQFEVEWNKNEAPASNNMTLSTVVPTQEHGLIVAGWIDENGKLVRTFPVVGEQLPEPKQSAVPMFDPSVLNENVFMALSRDELEGHIMSRFRALVNACKPNADISWYPEVDEVFVRLQHVYGQERASTVREVLAAHMLCLIFARTPTLDWFYDAEQKLFEARGGKAVNACLHVDNLMQHAAKFPLLQVSSIPEDDLQMYETQQRLCAFRSNAQSLLERLPEES